jgi:hypothetical protein
MPILQTILTSLGSGVVLAAITMWAAATFLKSNHGNAIAVFVVFGPAGLLGGVLAGAGYVLRSKALGIAGVVIYGIGACVLASELVAQRRKPPVLKLAFEIEIPNGVEAGREYSWFYSPNEQEVREFPPYARRVRVAGNLLTDMREMFDVADRRFIWVERQSDGMRERFEIPVPGYPKAVTGWSEWQQGESGLRFRWRMRHPREDKK